jgi:hypothetical protein
VLRSAGTVTLAATATRGAWRFTPGAVKPAADVSGRWNLLLGENRTRGLAILKQTGAAVSGTVQMPSGDVRYLAGELNGNQLRLSTFDGSFTNLWIGTLAGNTLNGRPAIRLKQRAIAAPISRRWPWKNRQVSGWRFGCPRPMARRSASLTRATRARWW